MTDKLRLTPHPTKEEWAEWLGHPMTALLRHWAECRREALKERWAEGSFSDPTSSTSLAIMNAGATGAASAYKEVIELDYESMTGELFDEQEWNSAIGPSGTD